MVVTDPGSVPREWKPSTVDDIEAETAPLSSSVMQSGNGGSTLSVQQGPKIRVCKKCGHFKPQRCHHCSVCMFTNEIIINLKLFLVIDL